MTRVTLAQLRQYVEDLEMGLTLRLDALETRLETVETDLGIIKEHLVTKMRADERDPDPDAPFHDELRIDPQFVAERLGLTLTESRVAVLLAEGNSVNEIAPVMGRKKSTVRWFLRQIHRKLKISRQGQLIRLVLLLPHKSGDETRAECDERPDAEDRTATPFEEGPT